MSKRYISDIIRRFVNRRYSDKTEEKVQRWMIEDEYRAEKEEEMQNYWKSLDLKADKSVYKSLDEMNRKLNMETKKERTIGKYFLKVAAVLIPLFLVAGMVSYFISSQDDMVTIHVADGENRKLSLPDNSVVWVNSGSTIKYNKEFAKESRKVYLIGEAFFSVTKDPVRHFIVETGDITVQVLGTEFNMSAYPDDNSITTGVSEGRVQVTVEDKKKVVLTRSLRMIYDKNNAEYKVDTVSINLISPWKEGKLIFEKKTLNEIFNTLERTYAVKVDNKFVDDKKQYTVKFMNNESIEEIISLLGEMTGFSHTTGGKTIKINKPD